MVEAESIESDGAPSAPVFDWTHVRGFQVLAAAGPDAEMSAADPETRTGLVKELGARAARFSQSVDDSIVLASDGLIRWLGDPVARLIAGDELLKPKSVLLADEALSVEDRESAQTRLALWISAHVSKVLGPLEALAEPGAVAEPVRALAVRIAQALGVLERERVRQQVKTLDQNARSALRKLGVRFGSMYIFLPALLKPGARTLCSQLWGLRRGEAGAERLLAFAAAGRTSFAAEGTLAPDTYRVAGFRLCGDRVVRIDIIERLNDLIRAAIPDHMRPGGGPPSQAAGFLVTPQMTSLTGCAGESFASILRSLGYESHRVKRSEFEAAMGRPTAPTQPLAAPVASAEREPDAAPAPADVQESDGGDVPASDLAMNESEALEAASPSQEQHVEASGSASDAADDENAFSPADSSVRPVEPELAEIAATPPDPLEFDPALVGAEPETFGVSEPAAAAEPDLVEAAETTSEASAEPEEASVDGESASGDDIETTAAEPADMGETPILEVADSADPGAPAAEEEWIEVWRPAPRRRPEPPQRSAASARPADGETAQAPRQTRDQRRRWGRDSTPRPEMAGQQGRGSEPPAVAAPPPVQESPEGRLPDNDAPRRQERGRRHFQKGQRAEEVHAPDAQRSAKETAKPPVRKEYRPAPVDMDSPFAKLLALKPLLERRDKRT
jgi:ATP-dependent RNA helicase SUPV3L1/SUV3